ncbi:hypothetical protein [Paragemmobacter straminiformis]|uniref:Uncharacterized protein n=1 Tax=Paragemmobacter straminiformis TaxID=2045119 RepID=A0A842I5N0_9RHOB|nr:hypothetical protein [Gemmobacter straminiformis]MBC2834969.1 hypothetical protein [Gemmobacter straminiformis]
MRAALILAVLAGPAAAGSFTPPEGCTTFLTVQSKGCRVSNHYTCEADPAGDKWRADFDQEGMFFLSRVNNEGEWVESYEVGAGTKQVLVPGAADPASFSELLARGRDDYRFNLSTDGAAPTEIAGHDALTGSNIVIDGEPLQQTEFEYSETGPDGTLLRRSYGNEYVSAKWRLFFAGPSQWDGGQGFLPLDGSPVKFSESGEAGFATTQPIFDCDAVMSSLPISPMPQEALSHDNL